MSFSSSKAALEAIQATPEFKAWLKANPTLENLSSDWPEAYQLAMSLIPAYFGDEEWR